jgi:hypothetical protein
VRNAGRLERRRPLAVAKLLEVDVPAARGRGDEPRVESRRELERDRVIVTAWPHTDIRMIPASDRLYRVVVEQRLTVPDHAELWQQVANTIMRHGRRGARLDKPSLNDPNDAVIALCMALEALENQPAPVEVVG